MDSTCVGVASFLAFFAVAVGGVVALDIVLLIRGSGGQALAAWLVADVAAQWLWLPWLVVLQSNTHAPRPVRMAIMVVTQSVASLANAAAFVTCLVAYVHDGGAELLVRAVAAPILAVAVVVMEFIIFRF